MSHRIDVRIPDDLYKALRKQSGTMTYNVCTALRGFVCTDGVQNTYDKSIVDLLQSQVMDLRHDKEYLQSQVNALMIVRTPLLQRVIMRLRS